MVLPQCSYKTFYVCYYQSALWKESQCVLVLNGHWSSCQVQTLKFKKLKKYSASSNRFTGHCMRQAARSTCTSFLSFFRYTWVPISSGGPRGIVWSNLPPNSCGTEQIKRPGTLDRRSKDRARLTGNSKDRRNVGPAIHKTAATLDRRLWHPLKMVPLW